MEIQHKLIQTKAVGGTLVLHPIGDIDMHESPKLRAVVLAEMKKKPQAVIVDLSRVGFIDSSGIATLVETLKEAKKIGAGLSLCGMSAKILDVFELARLDKVFKIARSLEELTGE